MTSTCEDLALVSGREGATAEGGVGCGIAGLGPAGGDSPCGGVFDLAGEAKRHVRVPIPSPKINLALSPQT